VSLVVVLIMVILITGITSVVSHPLTLLGSAAASLLFTATCLVNPTCRFRPGYLVAVVALGTICLLSSEQNVSPLSSTIHILACYVSLAGFAVYVPEFSMFCRRVSILTFGILCVWVLVQTIQAGAIGSWTVTGTAGAGNLMAAQLNMTLPFILSMAINSQGAKKTGLLLFAFAGMFAIVCVGSRNGIGSLLITLVLIGLFNNLKSAIAVCTFLVTILLMSDNLLRLPFVASFLARFRFVGYKSSAPRSLIWSLSSDYIQRYPWFGIGPGRSEKVLAVIDINHAHNNLVQIALESGIPAAIIALLVFASLLKLPATGLFRSRQTFLMCLPVLPYIAQSFTDIPIHQPQQTLLLVLCVCTARTAIQESNEEYQVRQSKSYTTTGGRLRDVSVEMSGMPRRSTTG